ncbi:hypothetical protein RXV95_05140 [Novosphingobium sp. ZN18A2]|uniref:hypothetical protein n=1 Tax=Novosphingobium sp. ZN18A2 TaxID=3079861 RepID=UPI0030CA6E13
MKGFFKNVSPVRAIRDLRQQFIRPQEYRWRFIALSAAMTGSIFLVFVGQNYSAMPKPLKVIYFPSFLPGRSDAQIEKGNVAAMKARAAADAEKAADAKVVRDRYKAMGDFFGMDTEKFIKEGDRERAAKRAAQEKRDEAILKQTLKSDGTAPATGN